MRVADADADDRTYRTLGEASEPGETADSVTAGNKPAAAARDLTMLAPPQADDELGRLANYRILKVLGRGGMGVVFQAEDVQLQRSVALKVMLPEMAASREARERFLREARMAAAIEHDYVVPIYQVGEAGGVPFLAMPWLKGVSLDVHLQKVGKLSLPQVFRLGRQVALGLAAAHARGLIHRDIKPANLWIEPGQGGRVRILDFGLARPVQTGGTELTQTGTVLGTPAYMAPEQARGEKVGPGCDLFSLGVVLYRMATGRMPFQATNMTDLLIALAMADPTPPHEVNPAIPAGLSDLILQLLAKDPRRRPASAQAVADALAELAAPAPPAGPFASDTVVVADRPVARRSGRRWLVAVAALAGIALLAGIAVVVAGLPGGNKPTNPTPEPEKAGGHSEGTPPVDTSGRAQPEGTSAPLGSLALVQRPPALAGVRSWTVETTAHHGLVRSLAGSNDNRYLASGGDDGTVRVMDLQSGQLRHILVGHNAAVTSLAWSPDNKGLASAGDDRRVLVWDGETGKLLHTLAGHEGPVRNLAWSPDGKTLASCGDDNTVRLWGPLTGEMRQVFSVHKNPVLAVIWQTNELVLSASRDRENRLSIWLWDAATGRPHRGHQSIAFRSPHVPIWAQHHTRMAYLSGDDAVTFWDIPNDRTWKHTLKGLKAALRYIALSPDGKRLATAAGNCGQLWDAQTGELLLTAPEASQSVVWLAFHPDGKQLASRTNYSRTIELWKVDEAKPAMPVSPLGSTAVGMNAGFMFSRWSADGRFLYAIMENGVQVWDATSLKNLVAHEIHLCRNEVAWSPDGKQLAVAGPRQIAIWETASGRFVRALGPIKDFRNVHLAWSPNGRSLAAAYLNDVVVWDLQTGKSGKPLTGHAKEIRIVAWSPDGKRLATQGSFQDDRPRIWDMSTGRGTVLSGRYSVLVWSPDGGTLATADAEPLQLWDAGTGQKLSTTFVRPDSRIQAAAWSRGGLLATGTANGRIRLARAATGETVREFPAHNGPVSALAWLPDDKTLVSLGEKDGTARFWGTDGDKPLREARGLPPSGRLSLDGRFLASEPDPSGVRLWDLETGQLRGTFAILPGKTDRFLTLAADGHYRLSPSSGQDLVYVVQTDRGQETLRPEEFEKRHGWRNDPEKVRVGGP